METAVAAPAPRVSFPLVDLDDLHDADLDGVLAEQLSDAVASASALAELVSRPGNDAVAAHALPAHLLLLAVF